MANEEATDVVVVPQGYQGGGLSRISVEDLRVSLVEEKQRRDMIVKYVNSALVNGTDYGIIPGCKKPSLWKPGAEKIISLLHLSVIFKNDSDTWERLPQKLKDAGTFCYLAQAITGAGEIVGEGRGCATIGDKATERYAGADANMSVKMAQKKAFVDLSIRVAGGCVSEKFSQDLEDLPPEAFQQDDKPKTNYPPHTGSKPSEPISDPQIAKIQRYFRDKGIDYHPIIKAEFSATSLKQLNKWPQGTGFITRMLEGKYDSAPAEPEIDIPSDALGEDPFPPEKPATKITMPLTRPQMVAELEAIDKANGGGVTVQCVKNLGKKELSECSNDQVFSILSAMRSI